MPSDDGCGIACRDADRAGLIAVEMKLGGVTYAGPDDHVVDRRGARADAAPNVQAIAVTESPSFRVGRREVQMPRRDDHPSTQLNPAGRSDERYAADRIGERSARRDRRRNAKHRSVREGNLELRLGACRADHADTLETPLWSVRRDGLRCRKLARLVQRPRNAERPAPKQRARVSFGEVNVTVRNADADVEGRRVRGPLPR